MHQDNARCSMPSSIAVVLPVLESGFADIHSSFDIKPDVGGRHRDLCG